MEYHQGMEEKKSEQISVKIEPEYYEKLKYYSKLERRSVGFLIRDMVVEWLEKKEKQKPSVVVKKGV